MNVLKLLPEKFSVLIQNIYQTKSCYAVDDETLSFWMRSYSLVQNFEFLPYSLKKVVNIKDTNWKVGRK